MIILRGLSTISFYAEDLQKAKDWYSDILGAKPYFEVPGYFEFRLGDYQHELGMIDAKYKPAQPATPGGAIAYWHVDDLESTYNHLLAKGAKKFEAITKRGEGFTTASVVDPFGNILGVMTNQHYLEVLNQRKVL